jgi:hypothetical protein
MARGRQLTLEEEYVKNGVESDQLLDELSKAAGDSNFKVEDLIDTYINERTEQDRLESLHEKGEVSKRVYERLKKEYDEKLSKMDEEIQQGMVQLRGYQAQIKLDHTKTTDDLETLKARLVIGDDVADGEEQRAKLTDKAERLNYALIATEHIIKKESTMRNGPITRFEVTEKTLTDTEIASLKPEPEEEPSKEPKDSESEPAAESKPSQPDAEAGKICTNCGRVTASDARFCVHCGGPL